MNNSARPHITALVLAAGHSRRMADANKLLLPLAGSTLLEQAVQAVLASDVADVIVVTGHEDQAIRGVLEPYAVTVAYNPKHRFGMATSLRRGLIAAAAETEGVLVCLGDMPFIHAATINLLIQHFTEAPTSLIVLPTYQQRPGHPVLFSRQYREALMNLEGDVGARSVLEAHATAVMRIPVEDPGILHDVDTREAYDQAVRSTQND